MIVANFMDSSLADLEQKGIFGSVAETYNPRGQYERVLHFTPHERDLKFEAMLAEHRIELYHQPAAGLNPFDFVAALWKVSRLFRREHVDIVRGRLPYLGSLVGALAARLRRLPMVVSLGGDNRIGQERTGSYNYNSRLVSFGMEHLVLRLASAIIVPNHFTLEYVAGILGRQSAERKCKIIPWLSEPVEAGTTDIPGTIPVADGAAVVPIIGFLNRYKFTDVLFDAFDGLDSRTRDGRLVQLVFCGDGPLADEGRKRFAGSRNVLFAGWQQRQVIHAMMRRAEFVLIPMSGFVLLEAASIGRPVIASNVEWHSEMVRDGQTGVLVDPEDPIAWRSGIERLLADPAAATAMGNRLKTLYWAEYAPDRSVALELTLYRELCRGI